MPLGTFGDKNLFSLIIYGLRVALMLEGVSVNNSTDVQSLS